MIGMAVCAKEIFIRGDWRFCFKDQAHLCPRRRLRVFAKMLEYFHPTVLIFTTSNRAPRVVFSCLLHSHCSSPTLLHSGPDDGALHPSPREVLT
ncbi:hypothetical protein I7I48_10873 [Histoplasma ohiense]|nr:hypothetical protein I7I48_10873 [Histoplasma ohiense (nom. inval.)]